MVDLALTKADFAEGRLIGKTPDEPGSFAQKMLALQEGLVEGSLIGVGKIAATQLANGAGLAALLAAGLGNSVNYAKTTNGAQTLLAAHATKDRACLIVVVVTEAFDDGDTTQTAFTIGETTSATKFALAADLADASVGDVFVFAGKNLATKNVIVTGTPAAGTGTGAISATILALPTS